MGLAPRVVVETLNPAERLAYVLNDMFAMPLDDVAPIVARRLARPGPGHDRGPDEHRADGGAHAPLSDVRALCTERWALSLAAPLSRLKGQKMRRRQEQS
jgi:hypothetical protein